MVVGSDGLLRNDDPRFPALTFLRQEVAGRTVLEALSGGSSVASDMRNEIEFLQAAAPLDFLGVRWAFGAEVDENLAMSPVRQMRATIIGIAGACLVRAIFAAVGQARSIATPLARMSTKLREVVEGHDVGPVQYKERGDEIGDIADSIEYFKDKLLDMTGIQAAKEASELREKEALAERQRAETEAARKEKTREARARAEAEAKRQEELAIATEIANVVNACSHGDFQSGLRPKAGKAFSRTFAWESTAYAQLRATD